MAGAKLNRLWFVIPTDIKGDGKLWYGPENIGARNNQIGGFAEEAPQPRRADNRRPAVAEDTAPAVAEGVGMYLGSKEAKEILAFTTLSKAQEYAKNQAAMYPSKLFGIFNCDQVFETTEPTVIEKKFNDAGELVLVSGS